MKIISECFDNQLGDLQTGIHKSRHISFAGMLVTFSGWYCDRPRALRASDIGPVPELHAVYRY